TGKLKDQGTLVTFGGESWQPNGTDIYLVSLTSGGTHRWSRHCTGATTTDNREGLGIGVDSQDAVAITGYFFVALQCGADTPTLTGVGTTDILTAKFAGATGIPLWMEGHGQASMSDFGAKIIPAATVDLLTLGAFQGQVTFGTTTLTSAGSNDGFLAVASF